ncbi:MAG: dihydropteroate synthase [Armatimonadetes bacterium]|nr:dihydropteroate synthase [Armatimonadota bacterium]
MGVLNVTPDSFSDGGLYADPDSAVRHARQMASDGADILDIGGESTRPATFGDRSPLPADEEKRRVLPVIARLAADLPRLPLSVDTYKAEVAAAALDSGASLVNDISGLTFDPQMAPLIASRAVPVILMHLLGTPRDIPLRPHYDDVVADICAFFERQIVHARSQGIRDEQIWLDPGLGFGKTARHNLEILRRLPELKALGYPLVVGASRKKFLGRVLGTDDPNDRREGTSAAVALSIAGGADIVRVHDVREMARVAKVSDAIVRGWEE